METENDRVLVVGISKGEEGLFTMDRNIEEKPLTDEEKELAKRREYFEKKYKIK
jgi:hypothetical protein